MSLSVMEDRSPEGIIVIPDGSMETISPALMLVVALACIMSVVTR